MDLRLDGKTALVTGASSGLGERFALLLAEAGARVALAARRTDRLETLRERIVASGGEAFTLALDVTRIADIDPAVERIEREFAPLDILVNNSGVSVTKRLGEYTEADYDFVMDTNTKGAFFVAQAAGSRMARRGAGRIINVASVGGLVVLPRISVYCMSKAAVVHMTKAMAKEWGRSGVNTNAICPGYIETDINRDWWKTEGGRKLIGMLPRKRVGQAEDLDGLVLLLASDASHFMNGAVITADDGLTVG
jgi:NAD(P)-dependent dehydrogenase (short-subunit alcohol dehydrogenase family)